jgi:hypothetical protein
MYIHLCYVNVYQMKENSLAEFEELVLLMVAALYGEGYGVVLEGLEEKLRISFE